MYEVNDDDGEDEQRSYYCREKERGREWAQGKLQPPKTQPLFSKPLGAVMLMPVTDGVNEHNTDGINDPCLFAILLILVVLYVLCVSLLLC